jgi:hypothetical protein
VTGERSPGAERAAKYTLRVVIVIDAVLFLPSMLVSLISPMFLEPSCAECRPGQWAAFLIMSSWPWVFVLSAALAGAFYFQGRCYVAIWMSMLPLVNVFALAALYFVQSFRL